MSTEDKKDFPTWIRPTLIVGAIFVVAGLVAFVIGMAFHADQLTLFWLAAVFTAGWAVIALAGVANVRRGGRRSR